ncbi:PREDICTED: uncharacterized protein LOC104804176 [Tarenaya hassleriana]|uniref:uncharacterized protein LOC104804176 n=1 Tax=Tarenaya hassleriana TaxID=28532 RepID=UPI00053C4BF4|nr:PREDICTED: uncharacterized protein LOC104804176 [Tarenaya hassleriana]XP_010526672.1 PREDICTED: uncharacterized protein LOC104804176 [Tarenaya hassleriana]XP_010526673.1 PREDICTED: uncharacterized protein LOC104804176 [Tarenaya hassleriana]
MERVSTRPGSEDPIDVCCRLLGLREFTLCRIWAQKARESDPNSPGLAQILAIADVLLAAESRIADGCLDFYSILQVNRTDCENRPVILNQFKKLVMLLSPSRNSFPFSREALNFICQAWSVLSKPEKKELYDIEIAKAGLKGNTAGDCGKQKTHVANAAGRGGGRPEKEKDETFWTMCPYCFFLYEYAKIYKELTLRCQSCRRAFHGMELGPLPASLTADGVESYTCQMGAFPIRYPSHGFFGASAGGTNSVVDVSDESESDHNHGDGDGDDDNDNDDCENGDGKEDTENGENILRSEAAKQEALSKGGIVAGRLNGKRVKMTAWNTRKGMEMRMRMQMKKRKRAEEKSLESDDDNDDCENGAGKEDTENDENILRSEAAKQEALSKEGIMEGKLNGKRVKMTAWNTRKGMEMRMRMQMKKRKRAEEKSLESDDDNDDCENGAGKEDTENGENILRSEAAKQEALSKEGIVAGRLNGKRVKMTAWNTRKGMEMRMRMQMKKRKRAEEKRLESDDGDGVDPEITELD